jgi:hypothetical protein
MHIQEIPALPFALDVQSATQWLDGLPIGNVRECCQRFFPVLQALNIYPMELRLRFDILEQCHPVVLGIVRGLVPCFMDKPFPLDGKLRKIAGLSSRFHLEAALGYRQLVETEAFAEIFTAGERILIVRRALEHLAYSILRAAQVYEAPSSSIELSLLKLYRYAEANGLLDDIAPMEREPSVSARGLFVRALLFRLAAPCRLAQTDMQRLFDGLSRAGSVESGPGSKESGARAVFRFDPEKNKNMDILVPVAPTSPDVPDRHVLSAEKFLPALSHALRASGSPEHDSLGRVLPRIGGRLPCQDKARGRRVVLCVGLHAIVSMLKEAEFHRSNPGGSSDAWPTLKELELAPMEGAANPDMPMLASRPLAESVAAAESSQERRMAEIIPTELPGFYLLDSGRWTLRTGLLIGLNSDNAWIQVGVLRGGQMRDGRFWHGFELLGAAPRWVRVRHEHEHGKHDVRNALLLDGGAGADESSGLIVEPVKWRGGDGIVLSDLAGKQRVHIARLVEATPLFQQFALVKADPAGAEG